MTQIKVSVRNRADAKFQGEQLDFRDMIHDPNASGDLRRSGAMESTI